MPTATFAVQPSAFQRFDEKWVTVRRQDNGFWEVHVRVFKLNTLRGDSYWNTLAYRTYQKKAGAEHYAKRFGWGSQSA